MVALVDLLLRILRAWHDKLPAEQATRAAFARRFKSVLGEPPLAYLTGWRMTMARHLLRETE